MIAAKKKDGRIMAVVTLWEQYVAPRFDMAGEILIAVIEDGRVVETRTVIPAQASADENCRLILAEQADALITGGIQRRYYEYLKWKKIQVYDSVMGPWEKALELLARGELKPEAALYDRKEA
jgi:predicted Fe-Mo cluster-binding NifX family protein